MGGLGNQMFQYAVGRHLAKIHRTKLKLDKTDLLDRTPKVDFTFRNYELMAFIIESQEANPKEIENFKKNNKPLNLLDKIKQKVNPHHYIREKSFSFNQKIFNYSGHLYLDGYWQSEKYFNNVSNLIRSDFIFKDAYNISNQNISKFIKSVNAVSLHVRRSDYVHNAVANQQHGTCSLEYYEKSIEYISGRIKDIHIFVFSDDPSWIKSNLKVAYPIFYIEETKNYEDMQLMSMCKHHIIANSTFSWWGAWLNPNFNKIVIAPKKWFNNSDIDTKDLIPDSWIKI
jgi:hypothetical protein